jgi:hypothetical protein
MGKKQFWLIVDTETTMENTVVDFGAVVCDRHGNIQAECAVLVRGHFGVFELFHDKKANDIWGYEGLEKRKVCYQNMLNEGTRMLASVAAINRWLERVNAKYAPELTAYNLPFDLDKCGKTGIDLSLFEKRFCLWQAAANNLCNTKAYKNFALANKGLTEKQNIKTNAEYVAGFITGAYVDEPHTALEDAKHFERPILAALLKKNKWRENMTKGYNWRDWQAKDNFTAI